LKDVDFFSIKIKEQRIVFKRKTPEGKKKFRGFKNRVKN